MDPVLDDLVKKGVDIIHFVSDGPTTQYRNKTNFHLMATLPFDKYHITHVTWNLLEASHGKGPADGIGAAVKSEADRLVATGCDVLNCGQLMTSLKNSLNVNLYEVTTKQIDAVVEKVDKLPTSPVKG